MDHPGGSGVLRPRRLVLVFAKNILLGKVKTRLAATIGAQAAFEVYKHLVELTEAQTSKLNDCAIHVWFSDIIIEDKWAGHPKFVQLGDDLGARMEGAFAYGFSQGYEQIIGIGTDLPDLNAEIMEEAFRQLESRDTVFGPAVDGGYYLLGMKQIMPEVFRDQAWSTDGLLTETLRRLKNSGNSIALLPPLNDIDTLEDLRASSLKDSFPY